MSMNGTKVLLKLGVAASEVALIGEISNSQDFSFDMIETTVKASPEQAKTYETGEYGGTVSCESKIKAADGATLTALFAVAKAGTAQSCITASGIVGDISIEGTALISGISVGNPENEVRTISYNLQYTGPITVSVIAV